MLCASSWLRCCACAWDWRTLSLTSLIVFSVVSRIGRTMKIPIAARIATVVTILMIGLMMVPAPITNSPR
jgi:hypothetical protein